MITKNYKNLLAMALQSSAQTKGVLLFRAVTGKVCYANGKFSFPGSCTAAVTLNRNAAGISVGTGLTPPAEDDYNLENTVTEGVTLTLTSNGVGWDSSGCPYVEYSITLTNHGEQALTITEIGYKQSMMGSRKPGSTDSGGNVFLVDRTMLAAPMTVEPDDAGVIIYRLKTLPEAERTVAGIRMASFTYGTDEEIAAMIDAARQGRIDLRRDGGWRVGDIRKIHVGSFIGGNGATHAEEDVGIAISSFEEYNGCGNLLQFDFFDTLTGGFRYSATAVNYDSSEVCTVTLPAMVEALPTWLKTRLLTFPVRITDINDRTLIHTVDNNKLALRASAEIIDTDYVDRSDLVFPDEGDKIDLYSAAGALLKNSGYNGTNSAAYLLRTTRAYIAGTSLCSWFGPTTANCLAPFGCL